MLLIVLIACWYGASSRNAVATQRLVKEFESAGDGFGNGNLLDSPRVPSSSAMLVLTALQLLSGICISWPLLYHFRSTSGSPPIAWTTPQKIALGALHFLGCICTNMGFALGSASVVQVIKLMEPIETMFLTALVNTVILKVSHGLTFMKFFSVITMVSGTALILLQKRGTEFGHDVNIWSVFFALCSGLAMASRNVVMKMLSPAASSSEEKNMSASHGWKQIAVKGLFKYTSITSAAAAPATFFLILAEVRGSSQIRDNSISTWMLKSLVGKEAIIFHGIYNIASISVLCLITAQSHSILNVGKRIANVLYVSIAFEEPIGFIGIMGLCIAAIGGGLYSFGSTMSSINAKRCFALLGFTILSVQVSILATEFVNNESAEGGT